MKRNVVSLAVLAAVGAMGLAACGGGGSAGGGGAAPQAVVGVITGFGSVYVNGVEYETSGASVSMDGSAAAETDLRVGMVVTLSGTVNADGTTGTATQVVFNDELEGVVLGNGIAAGSTTGALNVMGQNVTVTATTQFASDVAAITAPDLIVAGNVVEVSGYADGSGNIVATRIEVKQATLAGETIEVKGVVSALDSGAMTFALGGLTVDYSAASVPANLADGLYVEVKSTSAPVAAGPAYVLAASEVEVEGDGQYGVEGDDGDEVQVQGVVTAIDTSAGTLTVNGQTVLIQSDDAEDLALLAALQVGDLVQLEAHFANGVLVADGIENEVEQEGGIEIHATVEAVDAAARTVTLLGQTINLTNTTLISDARDENGSVPEHYFSVADVAVGDYVEVNAYLDVDSHLVAVEFERDDDHSAGVVELKGSVTSVAPLQVAGVTVDLTAVPGVVPALGDVLEVQGSYAAGTLVATEAGIDQ